MIDEKTLANLEWAASQVGGNMDAEIIRNARRYLALSEHGILLRQEAVVFDVTDLDAAADRLLEKNRE